MSDKPKTPLDLELNLFENSFASKDLLHAHGAKSNGPSHSPVPEAANRSIDTSSVSQNSSQLDGTSAGTSSEMLEIKPRSSVPPTSLPQNAAQNAQGQGEGTDDKNSTDSRNGSVGSSNKHNLRISNFGSLNNERLPGLTPPVFTPGGRRLPPIHLSPGLGMGSPGTPGSNMWSSLLTATNGVGTHPEQNTTLYTPPNYPQYLRKSGLVPTESNLRSGLTPGLGAHNGFNFGIPDAMANGQMTPGLQTLLGLVNTTPVDHTLPVPPAPSLGNNPAYAPQAPPNGQFQAPLATQVEEAVPAPRATATMKAEPGAKKEAPKTKKRPKNDDSSKAKAQKTSKTGNPGKPKPEPKDENKDAKSDDDGLDEEEKRKQFLERNRVAALKCRQRKKQQLSKMESELAFYSDGYRDLSNQVGQLRDHVMLLRGIMLNHKDCPALSNSVGGYQQLQNILAQAEFLAHGGKTEPGYPTMAMMGNPPVPKAGAPIVMNGQEEMHPVEQNANGMGPTEVIHNMHVHGDPNMAPTHNMGTHPGREHPYGSESNRQFSPANANPGGGMHQNKDSLRPINSTSNLQHVKHENQISGYDLRPIASMADLQPQSNSGMMARQFQL